MQHQLTVAYTPQQNAVAERMNRTIMNLVRSVLQSAGLRKIFWGEAVATAVQIRNRVSSHTLPAGEAPLPSLNGEVKLVKLSICNKQFTRCKYAYIPFNNCCA